MTITTTPDTSFETYVSNATTDVRYNPEADRILCERSENIYFTIADLKNIGHYTVEVFNSQVEHDEFDVCLHKSSHTTFEEALRVARVAAAEQLFSHKRQWQELLDRMDNKINELKMDKKAVKEAFATYIPTLRTQENTNNYIREAHLGTAAIGDGRAAFTIRAAQPGDIDNFVLSVGPGSEGEKELLKTGNDFDELLKIGRKLIGVPESGSISEARKPRKTRTKVNKEEIFSLRVDSQLKENFAEVCEKTNKSQADVIRHAMRHYIMIHTEVMDSATRAEVK